MEQYRHDSYCGLYCGACDIMATYKESITQSKSATWNDLPPEFQKNLPVPGKAEIICYGCKSDILFAGCATCPIRKCAKEMIVDICAECEKYPCKYYKETDISGELLKKLPHIKSRNINLNFIRKNGKSAWLTKQRKA